jgi:hypothetical protein
MNFLMHKTLIVSLCLLFGCLGAKLVAEPVDPADRTRLRDSGASLSGTQKDAAAFEDGGDMTELKRQATKEVFYRLGLFNDIEYQSNADLQGNGGSGAVLFNPGVEGGLTWDFAPQLKLDVSGRVESGIYEGISDQDYWGADSAVKLKYQYSKYYPEFYVGPRLYRFQSFDDGDLLSEAVMAVTGLNYGYNIRQTGTYPFVNLQYQHQWVTPSALERDVYRATVGVTQELYKALFLQAYYEYRYSDYQNTNRSDRRNILGSALIWQPLSYLTLRLNFNFIDNDSSVERAQYQTFNGGLGSALSWKF